MEFLFFATSRLVKYSSIFTIRSIENLARLTELIHTLNLMSVRSHCSKILKFGPEE
jgi:hypothetical protein